MVTTKQQRNQAVDIIRGIAMLMVVFGHTMTGCTENSQSSFLFNVIWSLQMPLFFLISGYLTKYSKEIDSWENLWLYIKRRTLAYMLPWLIWSVLIRGIVFGESTFLNISWLLFHMDSGYWFLFSIWTITMIFGVAQFIARKCLHSISVIKSLLVTVSFYTVGSAFLVAVGLALGLSFLCIKLTLYYIPFYLAGYIYGKLQDKIEAWKNGKKFVDSIVAVFCLVYLLILSRYNLFMISDTIGGIALRFICSISGAVAVCGLIIGVVGNKSQSSKSRALVREESTETRRCLLSSGASWIGAHSLEIYVIHSLLLSIITMGKPPEFHTPQGLALVVCNFVLTVTLSSGIVKLLSSGEILHLVLFGKRA